MMAAFLILKPWDPGYMPDETFATNMDVLNQGLTVYGVLRLLFIASVARHGRRDFIAVASVSSSSSDT